MGRILLATALTTFVLATTCSAEAPQTLELRDGKWQAVATSQPGGTARATTGEIVQDPELDRCQELIEQGHFHSAAKRLAAWFKRTHRSPDRALMLMARALNGDGNGIKAFYYLDELMDEHPESPLFYKALQMQYDIANSYLNGRKVRFLGIPLLGADDEAIEMLYRIQQRSPGSELAEKSLLRTATYFYDDQQYDIAAEVYGAYIKSYPRSPLIPQAKWRQAISNLAQFRGVRFDPTPALDARTQLADIEAQYPELSKKERVPEYIKRIDNALARKLYVTADFYTRTHEPRAAAYTYEVLLRVYPGAPEAPAAREKLRALPKPKYGPGGAGPATLPLSSAAN